MSEQTPLFLQKTVLDVKITFQSAAMQTPVVLNEGNGITELMEVESSDNIEYETTTTGDTSVAAIAVKVTGKIYLHPNSPAIQSLQNVNQEYFLNNNIIPGVFTVSSAAGGWSYQFYHVVITSPFKGYNLRKVIDDYSYSFAARLPKTTSLLALVNSAAGFINLV